MGAYFLHVFKLTYQLGPLAVANEDCINVYRRLSILTDELTFPMEIYSFPRLVYHIDDLNHPS